MAAATAFSALFKSGSTAALPLPVDNRPHRGAEALKGDGIAHVVPTTSVDDALDFTALIPVPQYATILSLLISLSGTLGGTGANDCDLIIRTWDAAGVAVDTMLYDSSANVAFTAAIVGKAVGLGAGIAVPVSSKGFGIVGLLCNTPGGTPAQATLTLNLTWW